MRSGAVSRIAVAVALVCATATATSAVAAPRPPACVAVAVSPGFARDGVLLCATNPDDGGIVVYRSADRGRTWQRRGGIPATTSGGQFVLSPDYQHDSTSWLVASDGVYGSTDDGRTWTKAASSTVNAQRLTPFMVTPSTPAVPVEAAAPHAAAALATTAGIGNVILDPRIGNRTVTGGPTFSTNFLVPAVYDPAVGGATVLSVDVVNGYFKAYACTVDFTCLQEVKNFGVTGDRGFGHLADGDYWLSTSDGDTFASWRTSDSGRTWRRWDTLDRALRDNGATADTYDLGVTSSPDAPRRIFALVEIDRPSPAPSTWRVLRSDDAGKTWRRTGKVPWNDTASSVDASLARIVAAPGGRLYFVAGHKTGSRLDYTGIYCSRDLGKTWRTVC